MTKIHDNVDYNVREVLKGNLFLPLDKKHHRMKRKIAHLALLVRDYDEAIDYYTGILDFVVVEDTVLSAEKRWVLVAPSVYSDFSLLLAKSSSDDQR